MSFQGDGTVDLVTTASTIHWLDKPSFMTEVSRVLRPGGVLAVYSYGFDMIHNKEAQQLVWEGLFRTTLRDDWVPDAHMHIDNGLALIELPFNDFQRLEPLLIEREVDIDSYIGFIGSWAPWQTYKKRNRETNILTDLRQRLRTLYTDGLTGQIRPIILTSPIYVLLGRK
ncbi:putative methyltransferase DDB_G0268948 [Mizuhopecten yessoensis]|nr:putative methyltransferase DDB_G0268948 [Mizuhopecten yessoensis]